MGAAVRTGVEMRRRNGRNFADDFAETDSFLLRRVSNDGTALLANPEHSHVIRTPKRRHRSTGNVVADEASSRRRVVQIRTVVADKSVHVDQVVVVDATVVMRLIAVGKVGRLDETVVEKVAVGSVSAIQRQSVER